MKKLELNQMESLEGGANQRNCGILGLTIIGGIVAGVVSGGAGWYFAAGAVIAAASEDCF
jgi:hypothetical protein